jgi:hypothetical protein
VRFALVAIAAVAGASAIAATGGPATSTSPERRVPCDEAIASTRFPYIGSRTNSYRLVLGAVSVPPAYMAQIERTDDPSWRYWHKQGMVVRNSGETVTISVPRAWRSRAAIAWGYGGHGEPFRSVVLVGCGSEKSRGRAYSGGFYLRARAACVPLTFRVGKRTATVRFGVGRRCK